MPSSSKWSEVFCNHELMSILNGDEIRRPSLHPHGPLTRSHCPNRQPARPVSANSRIWSLSNGDESASVDVAISVHRSTLAANRGRVRSMVIGAEMVEVS